MTKTRAQTSPSGAVDVFISWLQDTYVDRGAGEVDFNAAFAEAFHKAAQRLTEALDSEASPTLVAEAVAAARRIQGTYRRHADTFGPDIAARMCRGPIHAVQATLDRALTRFDRQAELDDAERSLADLEGQYAEALAALEAAVAAADVPQVMRLRGDVEVGLPTRIDDARITVLQLRIARAEAELAMPERRSVESHAARTAAEQALRDAQARLKEAQQRHAGAVLDAEQAAAARREASERAEALRAEHAELLSQRDRSRQTRMRRLAGLPEPAPRHEAGIEELVP